MVDKLWASISHSETVWSTEGEAQKPVSTTSTQSDIPLFGSIDSLM